MKIYDNMEKIYKADLKISRYKNQGFDHYCDENIITLEANNKKELENEIRKYKSDCEFYRYGDFGICLDGCEVEVVKTYQECKPKNIITKTVDELISENYNLHEAISILIQGIKSNKSSYEILNEWDKFRRNEILNNKEK